jgi:copper resistance protein D
MYTLLIIVHVLAALVWVGGVVFIGLALLPATRHLSPQARVDMVRLPARRFRKIGWAALAVLVISGLGMAHTWGVFSANFLDAAPNRVLGLKMLLVVAMIACSGLHDWFLGPKVSEAVRTGSAPGTARTWSMRLGQATMLLALLIVMLAVLLARPALLHQVLN